MLAGMRLLVAARLSKLATGQTGLESQDAEVASWAEREGHTVVAVAADHASGVKPPWDRPSLRPWVTDPAKIVQYDGVVAYRFDRLSRGDDASTSAIEDWARRNGKLLLTEDGLQYPCEGVEGIRWDVTKRIAHEEWLKTSERYRRMQAWLRDNDYLVGRPPFGYVVSPLGDHKTMVPDTVLSPYVTGMFTRYLAGDSLTVIAAWLDSEGIRPTQGGIWNQKSIAQILRNPVYGTGRRKDAAGKTILRVEPIVSAALQRQVTGRLDNSPRKRGAVSAEPALLTGLIRCGICHGPMYKTGFPRKEGTVLFYACRGPARKPEDYVSCRNMILLSAADDVADMVVRESGADIPLTEKVLVPGHNHDDEIDAVGLDIRELDLDDPEFDSKHKLLRGERQRLKGLPSVPDSVVARPVGITVARHWEESDVAGRRAWLATGEVVMEATHGRIALTVGAMTEWGIELDVTAS
jgi:site-specific DNA recombinase